MRHIPTVLQELKISSCDRQIILCRELSKTLASRWCHWPPDAFTKTEIPPPSSTNFPLHRPSPRLHCKALHYTKILNDVCQLAIPPNSEARRDRIFRHMKKNSQFTLRIPSELKEALEEIASIEGRSTAQVCEAFLRAGTDGYAKKGTLFIKGFLVQPSKGKKHSE
jgi:hypothetical protein